MNKKISEQKKHQIRAEHLLIKCANLHTDKKINQTLSKKYIYIPMDNIKLLINFVREF